MGNIEAHDFAPVRPDERKELNLSRKPTYKQYLKVKKRDIYITFTNLKVRDFKKRDYESDGEAERLRILT